MPAPGAGLIRLSVAGLQLVLDARGIGMPQAIPPAHAKFLAAAGQNGLTLALRDGALRETKAWRLLHAPPETWQLWQDESGCYVFAAGRNSPPGRQVTVDAGFRSGEVIGPFDNLGNPADSFYPLHDLDIVLFVNWLAESGDLILHASGVVADGRGYAFAGASGAGKSTLAAAFMERANTGAEHPERSRGGDPGAVEGGEAADEVTLLGEDNLVLRHPDGCFRIFGTPWHIDPTRCTAADAPLEKLFFLDRTVPCGVEPLPPADGIARLLQTAFIPYYRPEAVARILDTLARLAERVPFYTLSYRLGDDPLEIIRDA